MDEFTIYSIGDAAFLEQILNGVAMITGSGDFLDLVKIGLLLGIFLIAFQAILHPNQGIQFQHALLAFIVYSIMYGPRATVIIEDVYTGQTRVVANVPYGVAATGGIVSSVGYNVTALFEQAFSVPRMTEHGYASALASIATVRRKTLDPVALGKADEPTPGTEFTRSWYNYIKECTLVGIDLGLKTEREILSNPDTVTALRFNSDIYGTDIYISGATVHATCTEAWTQLSNLTNSAQFHTKLHEVLAESMGVAPVDVQPAVQNALTYLTGATVNAQQYMIASVLLPIYQEGMVGRQLDDQAFTHAVMARDAIEKRNTQWAAEQSLFMSIVRPMMTFFEGFTYAVTPIMAFLIAMGTFGISIAGRYLLTLLWIQAWTPTLAIVNLYMHMSAEKKMDAMMSAADKVLPAFDAILTLDTSLQNWLSTGGMLAASVPAISMLLVYGGTAVAATSMARRLQGSDHINEGVATPNAVDTGAVHQRAPMYSGDMVGGTRYSGAGRALPSLDMADNRAMAISSSLGSSRAVDDVLRHSTDVGRAALAERGEADKLIAGKAREIASKVGLSEGDTQKLAGVLTGAMGMGGSAAGISGRVQGMIESQFGTETATRLNKELTNSFGATGLKDLSAAYRESLSRDVSAGHSNAFTDRLSADERKALDASQSLGMRSSVKLDDLSNLTLQNDHAHRSLQGAIQRLGLGGKVADMASVYERQYGLGSDQARVAASYAALDNLAAGGSSEANAAVLGVASSVLGHGAGHGSAMPNASARDLSSGELDRRAWQTDATATSQLLSTNPAAQAGAWRAGVRNAADQQIGGIAGQQADTIVDRLRHNLGSDSEGLGALNNSNWTRSSVEAAFATGKGIQDSLKQAGMGFAGLMVVADGVMEGGWEEGKRRYEDMQATIRDEAINYAQDELGLTRAQAELWAAEQTNTFLRTANAAGAPWGFELESTREQREAVAQEVGNAADASIISDAVVAHARTGVSTYSGLVAQYNSARGLR